MPMASAKGKVKMDAPAPAPTAPVPEGPARFYNRADFLYLGRGINFPVALEGALKLKEISYIHAEGYPAGEMKHGPNALIDERLLVLFINTREEGNRASELRYEKTHSNIVEVKAREGIVISVLTEGDGSIGWLIGNGWRLAAQTPAQRAASR